MTLDFLIIGAGPAGLACAIEARRRGFTCAVVDKGCLTDSIHHFPADLVFFSTPDLLQVGELVFVSPSFRPTRAEVLRYYRAVADHYELAIWPYETVTAILPAEGGFTVQTEQAARGARAVEAKRVIVATGYYDNPNPLMVEGEDLPKVSHYYTEGHPYRGQEVAVIGGKNSAVEAALGYWRAGARVTLIHRGGALSESVKYWVRPDMEKRLELGQIKAMFNTVVTRITRAQVETQNTVTGARETGANDFVFALTGYHPDPSLLIGAGAKIDPHTLGPVYDTATLETPVKGLYVAGSIIAGINNNKVFIENSREHGKMIMRAAAGR